MPKKIKFHVLQVSGEDERHRAAELNSHSPLTQGWESSRYCLYPQEMTVQLVSRSRIRKIQLLSHQFLIATKVEFFVGDIPQGLSVSLPNAKYTRLGYIGLSSNEKTNFKARELKSVHVDAVGTFVKLVIHKNYINKLNIYNQVGIVAVNVIGDPAPAGSDHVIYQTEKENREERGKSQDFISPLDDLAFDMYQDAEVAQIIRKLDQAKSAAVGQERFDEASKIKQAIGELQKVGERLGKYEIEKRQAVEFEDFDRAQLKKLQMEEYRSKMYRELELHNLLYLIDPTAPPKVRSEPPRFRPARSPSPTLGNPSLLDSSEQPSYFVRRSNELDNSYEEPLGKFSFNNEYENRPLPTLVNNPQPLTSPRGQPPNNAPRSLSEYNPYANQDPSVRSETRSLSLRHDPADERPIPTVVNRIRAQEAASDGGDSEVTAPPDNTGEPEALSNKDARDAGHVIDVFGENLVAKAFSKTFSFREDALLSIYKQLNELPASTSRDELRAMLRAALYLIARAIPDKVFAVYKAAVNLLTYILSDFISTHSLGRSETSYAVEKTLPKLIAKTGDMEATRSRESAKQIILELASMHQVKALNSVPAECLKPFNRNTAPKLAQARTEIVHELFNALQLTSGITMDGIMVFCVPALEHPNAEVRDAASKLVLDLYRHVRDPAVKAYLPGIENDLRLNATYRHLHDAFDRLDGKPTRAEQRKQRDQEDAARRAELAALEAQVKEARDLNESQNAARKNGAAAGGGGAAAGGGKKSKKSNSQQPPPQAQQQQQQQAKQQDSTTEFQCIFCSEKSAEFTAKGLDIHYWKSCPMLRRCKYCKQVVEIATSSEHLLNECEHKGEFSLCDRCTEAIPSTDLEYHQNGGSCVDAVAGENHCPLCHNNFPGGDAGWRLHLMGRDGCPSNPRRLKALEKAAAAAGGGGGGGGGGTGGAAKAKGKRAK